MFEEKNLKDLFGKADESFNESFNNTLTKLKTTESKRHSTRMSTKAITFIVIICVLALSGTAYAVSHFTMQFIGNKETVDTGGGFKLVAVTENQWKEEVTISFTDVYYEGRTTQWQARFSEEKMQALKMLFEGEVFTADGEVFDSFTYDPEMNLYCIDDTVSGLYNIDGEQIGWVAYVPQDNKYGGKPVELKLTAKSVMDEAYQQQLDGTGPQVLTYDYEDAVEHMKGFRFRIPDIFTEQLDYDSIEFKIQKPEMLNDYSKELIKEYLLEHHPELYDDPDFESRIITRPGQTKEFDSRGVTVYVSIGGSPGLYYWAEVPRENRIQEDNTVGVDRIEEWFIKETDTTVYKLISSDSIRYSWQHDGIVYMMFNGFIIPNQFTDEQYMEIIYNMVT